MAPPQVQRRQASCLNPHCSKFYESNHPLPIGVRGPKTRTFTVPAYQLMCQLADSTSHFENSQLRSNRCER